MIRCANSGHDGFKIFRYDTVMQPYLYHPGTIPLIVSVPHCGTYVPEGILERLVPEAKQLPDTDWHVDRLYAFVREMGAHLLVATHARYVVDLNRRPDGGSLYPGQFTTGLCPTTFFDGRPLYVPGAEPGAAEIEMRKERYWQPYHDRLRRVIDTQKVQHGKCVLFDAHSIASEVPLLFDGVLPDLNFGTADGVTANAMLVEQVMQCAQRSGYSTVLNGRFKGGYITRHYGRPEEGVSALQLELAQKNYMQEAVPYRYEEAKALQLQAVLRQIIAGLVAEVSS